MTERRRGDAPFAGTGKARRQADGDPDFAGDRSSAAEDVARDGAPVARERAPETRERVCNDDGRSGIESEIEKRPSDGSARGASPRPSRLSPGRRT